MKSVREIGMKITAAQREYYRYTGVSAALERRGAGSSRPELAWVKRVREQDAEPPASSQPHSGPQPPNG